MARVLGPLAVILLFVLGFLWLASGGRDEVRGLEPSVIGTDGAAIVLREAGFDVRVAGRDAAVKASEIDLTIVPLYDMDLEDDRPETVGDTTQRSITSWQLQGKFYDSRGLVALPKWRWAAVQKSIAAPETQIPLTGYPELFAQMGLEGLKLDRGKPEFFRGDTGMGHEIAIFQPQSFVASSLPDYCKTWVWMDRALILIRCQVEGAPEVFYLSDPDLMNNHGLTLGDNARAFGDLVGTMLNTRDPLVYLDRLAADLRLYDQAESVPYERTSDDLWRYFKSPLGEIWAMLSILLALFLWRGARRFGPITRADEATPERSRREAVATRARLIRLTGQDAAMVADYVKTDLTRMAEAAFGPGRAEVARLFPLLARRNPTQAEAFQRLAQDLMRGLPLTPAALRRQLDTYHQLQRTLTHGDDAPRVP